MSVSVAVALILLVVACSSSPSDGDRRGYDVSSTSRTFGVHDARDLLMDSWVANDSIGYFIEGADGSNGWAFSLYTTYWNIRLGELEPNRTKRLSPQRLAIWLRVAATGGRTPNELAKPAEIHYAVDAARRLGVTLDPVPVEQALAGLRVGTMYGSQKGKGGDWGSTALAVQTLAGLGRPVPPDVRQAASAEIARHAAPLDAKAVVRDVAPLFEILAALHDRSTDVDILESIYRNAERGLESVLADPVGLATLAKLRSAAKDLGIRTGAATGATCQLVNSDGVVTLPGDVTADPQSTYYALKLGCGRAKLPGAAPYSRAGWPAVESARRSIGPTAAGLRLAQLAGGSATFTLAAATLHQIWIPELRRLAIGTAAEVTTFARICEIAHRLNIALPDDVTHRTASADSLGKMTRLAGLSMLPNSKERNVAIREALGSSESFSESSPITDVASLEIVARSLADADLHARAVSLTELASVSPGLYSTAKAHSHAQPSLFASLIAVWVRGNGFAIDEWIKVGLCAADGRCAETPSELASVPRRSLRVLSMVIACSQPGCGAAFPLPF